MRTKIFYYVLFIVSVLTLGSCDDKSTEGLTSVIDFASIKLEGSSKMILDKGSNYVEPGYSSFFKGENVTNQVKVSGTVDTSKSGIYTITYTPINNPEGYHLTATRTVIVLNLNSNIEGFYSVSKKSTRDYGSVQTYEELSAANNYNIKNCEILIVDNGDNTYYVSDLFGGWYAQIRNYGSSYAMTGNVAIDESGNITLVDSYVAGWKDSLVSLSGKFDSTTNIMKVLAVYNDGMKFNMIWTKKDLSK